MASSWVWDSIFYRLIIINTQYTRTHTHTHTHTNYIYIYLYTLFLAFRWKSGIAYVHLIILAISPSSANTWGYSTTLLKPYQLLPDHKSVLIYIYEIFRTKNVLLWIIRRIAGNKLIQQLSKVTPIVVGCGKKRKMKCIMWKP